MPALPEAIILRRLYWTSFSLRFLVSLLALILTRYFSLSMMEDALQYSEHAAELSRCWLRGEHSPWFREAMEGGRSAWFMVATLAFFYCFTGGFEFLPLALACYCLLTSITPILAYRAAREFGAPRQGALAGARLVAFSPAFAFWSSALYKEGLILIAMFLVIEHAQRLQRSFQSVSFLILGGCLAALFGLRFYIAAIFTVCIVIGLLFGRKHQNNPNAAPTILRQAIVLIVLATILSLFGIGDQLDRLLSVGIEENLSRINSSRRDLASYNSGYLRDVTITDVDSAARFLPVGMAYFLSVPLPWHIGSMRQNLAIPETIFWIVIVYPLALKGFFRSVRANPSGTLFLLLVVIAICFLYALFIGNIGTAYRVRVQVWAILALFASWAWAPVTPRARTVPRSLARLQKNPGSRTPPLGSGLEGTRTS